MSLIVGLGWWLGGSLQLDILINEKTQKSPRPQKPSVKKINISEYLLLSLTIPYDPLQSLSIYYSRSLPYYF